MKLFIDLHEIFAIFLLCDQFLMYKATFKSSVSEFIPALRVMFWAVLVRCMMDHHYGFALFFS